MSGHPRGRGAAAARSGPIRLVLLGDPVGHSRSPAIHRAALDHLGIEGGYRAVRAGIEELERALDELRTGTVHGINVTMPLKAEAALRCDHLTAEASRSGSANTLRFRAGRVEGHSTDLVATRAALADPRFPPAAPLLVLGSGGAAAATVAAVRGRVIQVAARNEARAARVAALSDPPGTVIPFGAASPGAIVVNATPIGMTGEALDGRLLDEAAGLIDLPYGQGPTGTVLQARERGLPHLDGVEFLVLQAAASFRWWIGEAAPFGVMLAAARNV